MLFSLAWRWRPSINCSYKPGTALAGERCSSSNISATVFFGISNFSTNNISNCSTIRCLTSLISKVMIIICTAIKNPGVSPVQLPNQHCAVNSSGRGEHWTKMKYLWFYWQRWTKMRKDEVNRDEAIMILMTKVNNSAMMAKSPMKDLLAWWQNAKLRIRKYYVVVDERGEGQRICED